MPAAALPLPVKPVLQISGSINLNVSANSIKKACRRTEKRV